MIKIFSYEVCEKLMAEKGVNSLEVAKATGIAHQTMYAWKAGKYTPKFAKLKAIADYFGVIVETFCQN